MRRRILITPERYFVVSAVALVAATVIVFGRRDVVVLGMLLRVVSQAILGGLAVLRGLAPGRVMAHYPLSKAILTDADALAWRSRPALAWGERPLADRLRGYTSVIRPSATAPTVSP